VAAGFGWGSVCRLMESDVEGGWDNGENRFWWECLQLWVFHWLWRMARTSGFVNGNAGNVGVRW